ncbi:MAG: InlB B-repeat-containing protein, partial [Clostridia bacterium]|nr:InlB B-repeat-containing protein [Clostridia bacterium]
YPANGYLVTSHPANFGLYNPIIRNGVEGERIISKEVVRDADASGADKTLFELSGTMKYMNFGANSQVRFLAVPADKPDAKWSDEGVSCIALLNGQSKGYYSGVDMYPGGVVGGLVKDGIEHFVKFLGLKLAAGGYSVQLWIDGGIFGGWAMENLADTRIAVEFITAEGESTVVGFRKNLTLSIPDCVADGEDLALNFNSYPETENTFYLDGEKWYSFATPSSQTANAEDVKGFHIVDGYLYLEGTSDTTMLAPKKPYGDFVLEFDYYDALEKPALVPSWTPGYSPLGVCFGRSGYNVNWVEKYAVMIYPDQFSVQSFNNGVFAGATSLNASTAGEWKRIKMTVIADKLSIYMLAIENGKTYTDYTAEDYAFVGEVQLSNAFGYVCFSTTEAGYFKLDNIRITNIDASSAKASFTDNAPIANSYVKVNFTVNSSDETKGTVTGGAENVLVGTELTVTATPAEHNNFVGWKDESGNTVSTEATYVHKVLGETTLTAHFETEKVNIVKVYDAEKGIVNGLTVADYGTEVTLTAIAATNYRFTGWKINGEIAETSATYTFTATEDIEIEAVFEIITYTVTASGENGTVTGAGEYNAGAECTLTATAAEGYEFVKWVIGDEEVSTNATYAFTVTGDVTLTAVFEEIEAITYTVTASGENGTVTGAGEYNSGAECTLTATAAEGYEFVKWAIGDEEVSTNATYTFTVTGDVTLTAVFEKTPEESSSGTGDTESDGNSEVEQSSSSVGCMSSVSGSSMAAFAVLAALSAGVCFIRKKENDR